MKKRYTDEQIGFLKQAAEGAPIKALCRRYGFSDASFYLWRRRFGGMDASTNNGSHRSITPKASSQRGGATTTR